MMEIEVSAAGARLLQSEVLTSGRVGLRCRLRLDSSWEGLRKTAVVIGSRSADLLLEGDEFCIPAECLGRAGDTLKIGLRGMNGDGSLVIPTVWVNCGEILSGAELSKQPPQEQTKSLLAQIMDLTARAVEAAARLREDADRGVFNGRDGKDGKDGSDGGEGPVGPAGPDGVTFTPGVSSAGVLHWSNDGGRPNPAGFNLVSAVLDALPDAAEQWTEQSVSASGAVTQALDPYVIYHFTGALTSLTVTLNEAASGQLAHYHFDFDCGSTAPTVTIPNTVKMPDGSSFDAGRRYELDILNNCGAVLSWANS